MNNSRWQQAKEIFDKARGLTGGERAAFLERRCSDNAELRAEVEKLLSSYDSDFLEESALGSAEALIEPALAAGQAIGRYRITGLIGSGGMGQVFLADDTELDRPVAFKILHGDVANDEERVRRFIQEARAASALNHPNILTIHEIGSFEGSRFIVSEYVHGRTLRQQMRDGLSASESLNIACQIATALKAAHAAGIVHRDIKPENIMIRQDGLVKVLDFGLAKLTEADDRPIDPNAAAASLLETSPGLVMGTVAYMSPEQARGQSVDARTDLWSLGVVLHEMLTGETPYKGEAVTELVAAILTSDATLIEMENIPAGVQPICRRLLAKQRDSRYQSAHDLLIDLEGEKERMRYAIDSKKYVTVSSTDERRTQLIGPRRTLSAEYIVHQVSRHKYLTLSVVLMAAVVALVLTVYRYDAATRSGTSGAASPAITDDTTEKDLKFLKLPISGQSNDEVISADGRYVAYTDSKGMHLLELETSTDNVILPFPPTDAAWNIHFSPDNKFVYYIFQAKATGFGSEKIMRIPLKGGDPQVIVAEETENDFGISPDGNTISYVMPSPDNVRDDLTLANSDGSNKRTLAEAPPKLGLAGCTIFSPNGKTIACFVHIKEPDANYFKLTGYAVANGEQRPISEKRWANVYGGAWLPNGSLVLSAVEQSPSSFLMSPQIWVISSDGQAKAVTSGLVGYEGLSSTRDGTVLLTHQVKSDNNLWLIPNNDTSRARQVTTSGEIIAGFTAAPDGHIITGSRVSGNINLWSMDQDGGGRKQLTHEGGRNAQPVVSPDNKYIVFISDRGDGKMRPYRMDRDGQNARQLADWTGDIIPFSTRISNDGMGVFYLEQHNGRTDTIRKVSMAGGDAVTLATPPDGWEFINLDINRSDGRIACEMISRRDGPREFKIGIIPANGNKITQMIDLPANLFARGNLHWMPDGRSVAMVEKAGVEIWQVPVDGTGKPSKLTDFRASSTYNFNWSFDGKFMLAGRGVRTSEPILIRTSGN